MTPYGHFPGRERYQLSATAPFFVTLMFYYIVLHLIRIYNKAVLTAVIRLIYFNREEEFSNGWI